MVNKRNNDWSPRSSNQFTSRPLLAVSGQPDPIGAQQSNPSQQSKQLLVSFIKHRLQTQLPTTLDLPYMHFSPLFSIGWHKKIIQNYQKVLEISKH